MSRITNRDHYVIAYDIADDRRRTQVFETCKDFGNHVQFSVFLAELDRRELIQLREILRGIINFAEDQVILVNVGPATGSVREQMEVLGHPYAPPDRRFVV